jgi:hypothetical protein
MATAISGGGGHFRGNGQLRSDTLNLAINLCHVTTAGMLASTAMLRQRL